MVIADELRRVLADRELVTYPDERAPEDRVDAAVLVPIQLEPVPRITVVVRSSSMADHPGEVAFPGGKPEAGDVDLIATALRETREELGLPEGLRALILL